MAKVKICGITELRDGIKARELGADFLGFVFFDQSPRKVEEEHARVIIEDLSEDILKVGLFLNQDIERVRSAAKRCHLDILQLHGDESPEYCEKLRRDFKIIKSFKIKDERSAESADRYEAADFYLFDTYVKGLPGGTGRAFDWNILKGRSFKKPVFLAGGLTPDNVTEAINTLFPYAVDVASGVEKSPGKKDYRLLKEFIHNAKNL